MAALKGFFSGWAIEGHKFNEQKGGGRHKRGTLPATLYCGVYALSRDVELVMHTRGTGRPGDLVRGYGPGKKRRVASL